MPYEFNCPNCSVLLKFKDGIESVRCDFCKQEIFRPKDKEDMRGLLNEADKLCQELRFDEALYLYNKVYDSDPQSAGAVWGKLRCKHGVEIVYEEETQQPYNVCHRRNAPWVDDAYYDLLKNDRTYRESINAIRNDILQFSKLRKQRERYDVFLCYKHTERTSDAYGQVTTQPSQDREWVRALYDRLNAEIGEKYNIFYAPVSLRELTGGYYAAGISYALSTARVMLVIGSKGEYFNGTWVRSEWKRFKTMCDEGCSRTLIPVCRDLNENELPPELQHLQSIMCPMTDDSACMDRVVERIQAAVEKQFGMPDPADLYRWHLTVHEFDKLKDHSHRLARSVQELENRNSALQGKLDDEISRRRKSEEEVKRLTQEYRGLKSENDSIHTINTKQAGKIFILEDKAEKMQRDLESRTAEIKKLTDQLREKESRYSSSMEDMKRRLAEAERAKELAEQSAGEAGKHRARAETLEKTLSDKNFEIKKLHHELTDKDDLRAAAQAEARQAGELAQQLQKRLTAKEAAAKALEEKYRLKEMEYTSTLSQMKTQLEEANHSRQAAEQQVRMAEANLKLELSNKDRQHAASLAEMNKKLEEASRARQSASAPAQPAAKPAESAAQPALKIGEYGFAYRDSSDTWRKCDADLSKVPADFRKDKLDHIYFTIENKSKKVQNIAIRINDPFGRQNHVFEEQKIKPNYSSEYRMPIKGDIRSMSQMLTVIAIDGAGKHTPVGPMAFNPK